MVAGGKRTRTVDNQQIKAAVHGQGKDEEVRVASLMWISSGFGVLSALGLRSRSGSEPTLT